ncbi:MAG: hypothetical protein PCFJNLEI_03640 [Verrucomicrobiae bacterium]|nr:hypothetical protein [Verrucomicrobiae bacterium]
MNTLAIVAYFAARRAVAVIVAQFRRILATHHQPKENHHD